MSLVWGDRTKGSRVFLIQPIQAREVRIVRLQKISERRFEQVHRHFCSARSATFTMRLFTCVVSLALVSFCLLGLTGCGEDNASLIDQQAWKTSGTQVETKVPPPNDQREFGERSKGGGTANGGSYPGAKRRNSLQSVKHERLG
jgi:hypothetical protein